jgi:hypothetical protein
MGVTKQVYLSTAGCVGSHALDPGRVSVHTGRYCSMSVTVAGPVL